MKDFDNLTTEQKRSMLNLEIRSALAIMDIIDGNPNGIYSDYKPDTLNEDDYLKQQYGLMCELNVRFKNIFKG